MTASLVVFSTDNKRFHKFRRHPEHDDVNILRIKNASSVAEAYQRIHKYKDKIKGSDKLIFVHDDVFFRDRISTIDPAIDRLLSYCPETIIGLAGTKKYDARISPFWWNNRSYLSGIVDHAQVNGTWVKRWTTNFGNYDRVAKKDNVFLPYSEVEVVDGLFLLMKKEYALENNPFESATGNHFYDIRSSLESKRVYAIDFRVEHHGLGDSMNCPEYREEARKLILAYKCGRYPKYAYK